MASKSMNLYGKIKDKEPKAVDKKAIAAGKKAYMMSEMKSMKMTPKKKK